jgi:Mce-associated membrane protein
MPDTGDGRQNSAKAKLDALALAEQAEAEAAEAEALAAAARARARAIQLRREAEAEAEAEAGTPEADEADDVVEPDEAQAADRVAETPEPTGPAPTGRRLRVPSVRLALSTAAVLAIVGLLGASGWMAWQHQHVVKERQSAAAYIATARQGVINLTSLTSTRPRKTFSASSTLPPANSKPTSKSAQMISRRW